MKITYLDCSSGISGDMLVGALLDAGVPFRNIEEGLSKLPLKGFHIKKRRVMRCGIRSTKFDVILDREEEKKGRKWSDVQSIIQRSKFDRNVKEKGLKLFKKLFEAEAKVHGKKADTIHLHELGALDCIVDIFSVLIGLQYLDIEKIYASPVNLGSGAVETEHGILPVPAPATLELLKGVEVYSTDTGYELTTPTGALLVSELADEFGSMPLMEITKKGYGAGGRDLSHMPNVLRLIVGEAKQAVFHDEVYVVETNIDDMNPQHYDYVMDLLFEAGALDVFMTPVYMKKQRPGIILSVLANRLNVNNLTDIVLRETTSIGVRFRKYERVVLQRELVTIKTAYGPIKFKKIYKGSDTYQIYPEYDECKRIAKKTGISIQEISEKLRNDTSVLKKGKR